jgi:hypothetical protein
MLIVRPGSSVPNVTADPSQSGFFYAQAVNTPFAACPMVFEKCNPVLSPSEITAGYVMMNPDGQFFNGAYHFQDPAYFAFRSPGSPWPWP